MRAEIGDGATVVATGGLAPVVVPSCERIDHHDEWLTLEGLRLVFDRNVGPVDD
jgi:type III pantothenate kinase